MWGDLIFLISPFIMPKFADNLTISFVTETFVCKTSINYKLFCLIIGLKCFNKNLSSQRKILIISSNCYWLTKVFQLKPLMSYKIITYFFQLGNQNIEIILRISKFLAQDNDFPAF